MSEQIAQIQEPQEGLFIKGLKKVIGKRTILKDVNFSLKRGEVVALLGPNGAGKTTSFHSVIGLVDVTEGEITLDGVDITHAPVYTRARYGLGYLPQEASIFRGMSVEDNIRSVLEMSEANPSAVRSRLKELLREFGITHIKKSPSTALSGGERRRLEIARALASRPVYMMLDEPFAGVDPIAVGDVRKLVAELKNRGIGVLITDHNVRETLSIVDRACILHDGRIIMEGTPEEIVANEEVRRVYLGENFKLS
jgi:lipopolysaccharide export system ATP-binding protein